jgi:hypothetical protein
MKGNMVRIEPYFPDLMFVALGNQTRLELLIEEHVAHMFA